MTNTVILRGPRIEFHEGITSGGTVSFTFEPPYSALEFAGVELASGLSTDTFAVTARSNSGVTVSVSRLVAVEVLGVSVLSSTLSQVNGVTVRLMACGS